MAIKNSFEKHYGETKTVFSNKELNEAVNACYGKIIITGDLFKDMKENYEKKTDNKGGIVKGLAGLGIFNIVGIAGLSTVNPILGLFLYLGSLGLCGGSIGDKVKAEKYRKYRVRLADNDPDTLCPTELILTHKDIIEKNREWMKGKDTIDCGKDIDMFNDAMELKINTIIVDKATMDKYQKEYVNVLFKDEFKKSLENNGKYFTYRVNNNGQNYKFSWIK